MTLRVLFLGETWSGSGGSACSNALRRLGCDVHVLDYGNVFPSAQAKWLRLALRVTEPAFIREYNSRIAALAGVLRPDILMAFKGMHVSVATLRLMRRMGIALYNYYPDRLYFAIGTPLADSLCEYDCFFDTKGNWETETRRRIRLRARVFLPHGYDPDVHYPIALDARDVIAYGCDVSVIATYSSYKEEWLAKLLDLRPKLDLRIWGNDWDRRCRARSVRRRLHGRAIVGTEYSRALRSARINLALLGVTADSKDTTTTRTFEIPATGGFMLHERTDEVIELFHEAEEVATYESPAGLAEKIDFYLSQPGRRDAVAAAGYARCVPRYSYDERMKAVLAWHRGARQMGQ